jgi:hypothetical protein
VTYFSLRKDDPEPAPVDAEEAAEEQPTETDEEVVELKPARAYGPVMTGFLGPGQWIAARFGIGAAWTVHAVAGWAIWFYGGWIAAGVIAVWLAAVVTFVPREAKDRLSVALERRIAPPEVDASEAVLEPLVSPLVGLMWHHIGDAPGVHLKTLAERLQAGAPDEAMDRAVVRAKLGALSIPVRGSVRDAAGRVNEGVHRDDLAAWQAALPDHSSGTPSEPRSGSGSDAVTCEVGGRSGPVATLFSYRRKRGPRGAA